MCPLAPLLGAVLALAAQTPPAPAADPFARWEKEVAGIEKRLADKPPGPGGVVFAGSSNIRLWNLGRSFPDLAAVNVGFGGSEIRGSTHFAPRIVLPLEPRAVVFYAGDNDLAKGRTPDQVRDDFAAFVNVVHGKLPRAKVLFVAVKPSLARWKLFDQQRKANGLVKALCGTDDRLRFVDVVPGMLGSDGKPIPELFVKDGLHLSEKGYEVWTAEVKKALQP